MNKPSQTDHHLANFLASFDTTQLGEGDIDAGANLLAAMAVTLGNLARPGSGIRPPSGRLLPVGTNLLATGPLVSSLVIDEVVTPVGRCQDNLLAQLTRLLKDDATERAKETPRQWVLSKGPQCNEGENALLQLMTRDSDLAPLMRSREDEWMSVLSEPPAHRLEDLVRHPRSFIAAHTQKCLEKLLPDAHLGEALVSIGLTRAADAANLGSTCPSLMDGMFPGGPAGELVRGRLIVTDHGRVLREVAAAPNDRNAWLGRLVWLVEGGTEPVAPSSSENEDDLIKLPNPTARFEEAVLAIIANRLDSHEPRPLIYTEDIAEVQTRWMRFLRSMDESLPGISGTARSFFCSLAFGLIRLAATSGVPKGFRFQIEGALAFACFLVRRMAAIRNEMFWSPEQARRVELKKKLVERLADGPQEVGCLIRRFHRLRVSLCNELLIELEEEGEAVLVDDRWKLATPQASAKRSPALKT
ncbi:MAG: hypothetical protein WD342_16185 [Verrucomicrobiales bacterium]